MGKISAARLVAQALGPEAKFVLVCLSKDGPQPVYDGDGELLKFATGGAASTHAEWLARETGQKYQPRPVNDGAWHEREKKRMLAKDYLPLPWASERWWTDLRPIWGDHYPHASVDKEAFLAFTESPEKGSADIQTRIKPGRYLERYFGEPGILSPHVVKDLCSKFSNQYEANIVYYAATSDEIEKVYLTGPTSCMSKRGDSYPTKEHPVRMYAAGDLQVAYLKRDDKPSARVVIWPEKKIMNSSFYGDSARLRPILTKQGYKEGILHGAKLLMKKSSQRGAKGTFSFIAPHADGCNGMHVQGDHLILGPNPKDKNDVIAFGGGSGVTELVVEGCQACEDKRARTVRGLSPVISGPTEDDMAYFCAAHANKVSVKDHYSGQRVHKDFCVEAYLPGHTKPLPVWQKWVGQYIDKPSNEDVYYDKGLLLKVGRETYSRKWADAHLHHCRCGKYLKDAADCKPECGEKYDAAMAKAKSTSAYTPFATMNTPSTWGR